ncbi:MAG: helix-turn-helix domain-containing protein [Verrucomicrobiae bacterium]
MTFGQYIRSLRSARGITQRALSQAVGFRSLAHLSDIESGKRSPSRTTFARFAKALDVSVSDLECRDVRGPIEAAKALFSRNPEMVGAFLKVIEAAKKMDAQELVARVTGKPSQPEPVALQPAPPPPTVESRPAAAPAKPQSARPDRDQKNPEKPVVQPTLF